MNIRPSFRSIRTKFLVVGVAAVTLSVSVSLFLAAQAQQRFKQQMRTIAADDARQAAFVMAPLIAFDSHQEIDKALALLRTNPDFAYARVFDANTTLLASLGDLPPLQADARQNLRNLERNGIIRVVAPIADGAKTWGYLQLGISQRRTQQDTARLWSIAGGAAFFIMLITVVCGAYLAASIASPIRRLAEAVSRVEQGDWDTPIEVESRDEVGQLARSFRRMIRELHRSKSYVDDILHSMADSLLVVDAQGRIQTANPATSSLLGCADGDLISEPIQRIAPGLGLDALNLNHGRSSSGIETEYVAKDGTRIPVLTSLALMGARSGNVICMAQDLRERKRTERELLQAKEAADSANRAKSAFLANMSHEIRTPMNAILGYSQLMLRDPALGAGAKENLKIINRSGGHLLGLINDILDMSKIEAGQVELNPTVFDLYEFLQDLEIMFRLRTGSKGLKFELRFDPGSARHIETDKGRLRQVFINLLGNAVKFTGKGSITLRVSTPLTPGGDFRLAAAVEDTGVGISAEEQTGLFRPFVQSHSGRNLQGGTGLGLAISREFIRMMGGEIGLVSEPGKGSIFHFEIPIRLRQEAAVSEPAVQRRVVGLQPDRDPPKLLVVDDEAHNRGWLTGLLKTLGFEVREAENGADAVELWRQWKPALILMDLRMPVMNGFEATRKIREYPDGRKTVIVALTASALEEDRHFARENGADSFLSKPCREDDLLAMLKDHLDLRYRYDDAGLLPGPDSGPTGTPSITLRDLPAEWISELGHAIKNGETDRMEDVLRAVGERDARLAVGLKALADSYEYDALAQLVEEAL